jgi:hypothetical protein
VTRAPSEAVIEAVERAQTLHGRTLPNIVPHTCVCGAKFGYAESYFDHYRAAEAAALRAAAERMDDLSRGAPLAAAITARAAAIRLDHWADELTDEAREDVP